MQSQPDARACVHVAVAAVVDKMSPSQDGTVPRDVHDTAAAAMASTLQILITRRRAEQVLGGYWELPGGKLEDDESAQQAVVRELYEEVGIEVRPIVALDPVEHHYDHAHVRLIPFICRRTAGTPRALEVDEVRWAAPDTLDDYLFPDASLPIITALKHWLEHTDPADLDAMPSLLDPTHPQTP